MSKKKFKLGDGYIDILVQFTQNNDKVITQDAKLMPDGSIYGSSIKDAESFSKDVRLVIPICLACGFIKDRISIGRGVLETGSLWLCTRNPKCPEHRRYDRKSRRWIGRNGEG